MFRFINKIEMHNSFNFHFKCHYFRSTIIRWTMSAGATGVNDEPSVWVGDNDVDNITKKNQLIFIISIPSAEIE